jgi:transposase InsO family protein
MKIYEFTKQIVESCEAGQKRKVMTTRSKETVIKQSTNFPFESIFLDFCGPFKQTFQGKKYILAIIDQFSRYISLNAVAKQDEKTTADILLNRWILKYGAPRVMYLDCGKSFQSKVMKELAERYKIQIQYSSPYHHNTNGLIERQFRTIRDFISSSLKDKNGKTWVDLLPEVEYSLNATTQKSIGMSPAEVVFGFPINRQWNNNKEIGRNREDILNTVRQNQSKIAYDNSKRGNREFNVGEHVLVKVETRSNKDDNRYEGPMKIHKKRHDRSYELQDKNGKLLVRNIEWLKPFKTRGM